MPFPSDRDLSHLDPLMKPRVTVWLQKCKDAGLNVLITEGKRSQARQLWLYAKGRVLAPGLELKYLGYDHPEISSSPKEKSVTWTLQSKHLEGKAIDFGFLKDGKLSYDGPWDKCFDLAEKCGLESLYRKEGIDRPHLQLNLNFNPVNSEALKPLEEKFALVSQKANEAIQELNHARADLARAKGVEFRPYKLI
mgnify:CR=1 FL=1